MAAPSPMPWRHVVTTSTEAGLTPARQQRLSRPPAPGPGGWRRCGLTPVERRLRDWALSAFGLLLSLVLAPARAAGIEDRFRGECFACHGEAAYTRPDRRVNSPAALVERVRGCTRVVGGTWNEAEVAALVELLDARYYRFP